MTKNKESKVIIDGVDVSECEYEKLKEEYQTLLSIHNSTVKQYEALQKQYITVLDLAKKNSDSYEYCLKNLEEKIAELTDITAPDAELGAGNRS